MLESLEQSNIKRMSVEKPEQGEFHFDPEKYFTSEDWRRYRKILRNRIQENKPGNDHDDAITRMLWCGKQFGEDLKNEISPTLEKELKQRAQLLIDADLFAVIDGLDYYIRAGEVFPEWQLDFGQRFKDLIVRANKYARNVPWGVEYNPFFLSIVANHAHEKGLDSLVELTDKDFQKIKDFIPKAFNEFDNYPQALEMIRALKNFDPNFDMREFHIDLDKLQEKLKTKNTLLAYEVSLLFPKAPITEDPPPLPEQRNF